MSWFKRNKKEVEFKGSTLPASDLYELKRVLTTPQIECFEDCFIPFIQRLRSILRVHPEGEKVFQKRFKSLCAVLEALKQHPSLPAQSYAHHARIKTVTVFVVLRVLLRGLPEEAVLEGKDNIFYAKRIPPMVRVTLSPESYRLFECHSVIFGDMNTVQLNADLTEWLIFSDDIIKKLYQTNEATKVNTLAPPEKKAEAVETAKEEIQEEDSPDAQQETAAETVKTPDEENTEDDLFDAEKVSQNFNAN